MELSIFILLFVVGIITSFIGGIAGGGGALISFPALLFLGLPPHVAVATTKFGAIGSGISTVYKFGKSKKIVYQYVGWLTFIGVIGSVIGAHILINLDEETLSTTVGIILILLLPLMLINDKGFKTIEKSKKVRMVGYFLFFLVAIYGGFFGAAGGILILLVLVYFFGLTYLQANATLRIPWFVDLLVSSVIYALAGIIHYSYGLVLIISRMIGGYLGAHVAITKGSIWIKWAICLVMVATSVKLLFF